MITGDNVGAAWRHRRWLVAFDHVNQLRNKTHMQSSIRVIKKSKAHSTTAVQGKLDKGNRVLHECRHGAYIPLGNGPLKLLGHWGLAQRARRSLA